MAKAKRNSRNLKLPLRLLLATWIGTLASLGLLYFVGKAFMATLASFRSCSANDAGLQLVSCGKGSPNAGDFILFGLFALSACLVVTMVTASWQMIQRLRAK